MPHTCSTGPVSHWKTLTKGFSLTNSFFSRSELEMTSLIEGFPSGSDGKASAYNVGDPGLIPGLGRSPGEGNGNPLQYSCLENPGTEEPGGLQSMGSKRVGRD